MTPVSSTLRISAGKDARLSIAGLVVQSIAAIYFFIDGADDVLIQLRSGVAFDSWMEVLIALALVLAIIISARYLRSVLATAERQRAALVVARGSIAELLQNKFGQWNLSPSEGEVALFALKGCTVAEIAQMRGSAEGTVRSQLSQVYAKANVSSQSMLISQFIEELL